jgi:hypothetical protein
LFFSDLVYAPPRFPAARHESLARGVGVRCDKPKGDDPTGDAATGAAMAIAATTDDGTEEPDGGLDPGVRESLNPGESSVATMTLARVAATLSRGSE